MKTQVVTATLKKAGFTATKITTGYVNGVYTKIRVNGYSASVMFNKSGIAIECCFCMDQIDSMYAALIKAGFNVVNRGNGILVVTK